MSAKRGQRALYRRKKAHVLLAEVLEALRLQNLAKTVAQVRNDCERGVAKVGEQNNVERRCLFLMRLCRHGLCRRGGGLSASARSSRILGHLGATPHLG